MIDLARLQSAYQQVRGELLAERTPDGHWVGELSSSALSTATAVSALAVVRGQASGRRQPPESSVAAFDPEFLDDLISRGIAYLAAQQNADGGFGDTDLSHSNIATTYLVVAAIHLARQVHGRGVSEAGVPTQSVGTSELDELLAKANAYIETKGGLKGLRERYGIDKTFVVPIMTNLALAGLLDWREIDPLPFELACVPQAWYRFVGMPVVSYAIPALVAIGQARYHHAPPWNPITRLVRWLSISRSLKVLRRMQPDSGGYLEATPLTSFVVMSLASIPKPRPVVAENDQTAPSRQTDAKPSDSDQVDHHATTNPLAPRPMVGALNPVADDVIREGVKFLAASIRPDGSWPIDTNLATWNTTLAINALAGAGEDVAELLGVSALGNSLRDVPINGVNYEGTDEDLCQSEDLLDWILFCQHTERHPFTGADPGGFGWTDLSGAVPDADDTPGALLAINDLAIAARRRARIKAELRQRQVGRRRNPVCYAPPFFYAARKAHDWLLRIQNRDGGWPTFCRGWGKLPFDRSGVDLTAHAIRAIALQFETTAQHGNETFATQKGFRFIERAQHPDGSWSPLWFGNQDHPQEDNPVYGTAKVLMAYRDLGLMDSPEAKRGVAWLVSNQNADGGWGSGVWGKAVARGWWLEAREEKTTSTSPQPLASSPLLSSVEETALAVEALLAVLPTSPQPLASSPLSAAVEKGLNWLLDRVERGEHRQPAPIGFYFAKLWYYERLYPLTFTVAALGRACRQFARPASLDSHAQPAPSRAP